MDGSRASQQPTGSAVSLAVALDTWLRRVVDVRLVRLDPSRLVVTRTRLGDLRGMVSPVDDETVHAA